MTAVVAAVALDMVEAEAVVMGVKVDAQEAKVLANLAISPNQYLMIVDRIPSTTPGAEPPRDARDSGSARSHSMHLETSSSDRP